MDKIAPPRITDSKSLEYEYAVVSGIALVRAMLGIAGAFLRSVHGFRLSDGLPRIAQTLVYGGYNVSANVWRLVRAVLTTLRISVLPDRSHSRIIAIEKAKHRKVRTLSKYL
ncbi:uncharacterized protein MYCFIDRAFT_184122 [Pseudocercospora fijiensis CIRAD86]|uniref:Uncharacterized protein n=1 Tax=Pseudocercospora fijiensis (strain CIRAD86) TaxID=383855 RepID=M3AKI6_PSEFD|nr:uncharacterized protein MYCFIDRAFT_184122 [Pseudocercospora fijiensis CIRAD86]EME77987.1 hypothetical protein MYCFIDRAFT_184122 [Pseudocercospora fijiensis CIRAD86]